MNPRRRLVTLLAGLAIGAALAGCGPDRSYLDSVDVPGDRPTNEKVEIAQAIATREGQAHLLDEVRKRFPALTEDQTRAFVVTWRVYGAPSPAAAPRRERVAVVIGFRHVAPPFDPRPVVDYCKGVLARQLEAANAGS